jgi:hypothetical protein
VIHCRFTIYGPAQYVVKAGSNLVGEIMKKIKYENLVKFHKLSLKQTESDDTIVNEFHNMSERVSVEFRFLDEK